MPITLLCNGLSFTSEKKTAEEHASATAHDNQSSSQKLVLDRFPALLDANTKRIREKT